MESVNREVLSMATNPVDSTRSAMPDAQREFLEACEQANRAWLARVKSEVDLWSELARKLSTTRSAREALDAYQTCMAERIQMAAGAIIG